MRFIAGRIMPDNDSFSGGILGDIGFGRPAAQDKVGSAEPITMERIPKLDGDWLIYFAYATGDGGALEEAGTWLAPPCAGHAGDKGRRGHGVSDTAWATAGGITATHLALDDIVRHLPIASTR